MKDAADCLAYIKALIVANPKVIRWTVVREEAQEVYYGHRAKNSWIIFPNKLSNIILNLI